MQTSSWGVERYGSRRAAALLVTNGVLLSRARDFAWWRFFQVMRWGLLAYFVVAGMLEYTFLYDHTHGALLAIMTCMLVLFMVKSRSSWHSRSRASSPSEP
ncbi:MAG: hypothetical protein ACXVRK_11195 [Gaiellaceae bacterium]